jgi:lactose/L-arabinose transport system permease protein
MSMVRSPFSLARVFLWAILIVGAFICVFPFYWMMVGSTLNPNEVVRGTLLPGKELLTNIEKATRNYNLPLFFLNSLFIASFTVIVGVSFNAMAAFGFEKYPSKAREWMFGVLLLTLIIPQIAIVLPLFKVIAFMGLLDTPWAIIMPVLMSAFIIFFLRQNFKMFPTEIIEAARVDGSGEWRIFWLIALPSMKASFASAGILMFIGQWNSYLWPLMTILSDAQKTLPIAMSSMMNAYTIEYGGLMVIVTVSMIPVLAVFLGLQKQFVAGLLGSVK